MYHIYNYSNKLKSLVINIIKMLHFMTEQLNVMLWNK